MNTTPKAQKQFEIMLVEDNPADARLVALSLKGFEVQHQLRVVTNGQLAMDILQQKEPNAEALRPDLILLDWNLPGKSGGEILREIRRDPALKEIPVVVLTGLDAESLLEQAYDAGTDLFITKPITLDRVSVVLQYVIDAYEKGNFPNRSTEDD
jgi:CheY-like chemotaxis protein